jgi:hypothetical protein
MEQEVWKNATQAQIVVVRNTPSGHPRHEVIVGGRNFSISAEDRMMNQNMSATPELDVFANGMLQPVKLPEGTDPHIMENPNHIPDDQLPDFFKLHYKVFPKRLSEITNPVVLERLLSIAEEQDATVKQISAIRARLDELNPPQPEPDLDETGVVKIKPVTPR